MASCSTKDSSGGGGSSSNIRLVRSDSYCTTNPYNAKLFVYVAFRNTGTSSGSVDVIPWRRYSDGSVNDSVVDQFTVTVPAGQTKKVYGSFDYNPQAHDLLECGVELGDNLTLTQIAVR